MSIKKRHYNTPNSRRSIRWLRIAWLPILIIIFSSFVLLRAKNFTVNTPPRSNISQVKFIPPAEHGNRSWTYNFNQHPDGPLSQDNWNFDVGNKVADYNNEAQSYTSSQGNVRVENGVLVIEAKPENSGGKLYTSARINTFNKFDFVYGTLEVDMMLPKGVGTWPAAWLLPSKNIYKPGDYGISQDNELRWALNGEIDFAEAIGSIPGQNIPANHSYNSVHSSSMYTPGFVETAYTQYHRYGIVKTHDKLTFTLDGVPYASRERKSDNPLDWPYDQPYYLIINLALGGKWAGQEGIDNISAPWQLKVRSVSYDPL